MHVHLLQSGEQVPAAAALQARGVDVLVGPADALPARVPGVGLHAIVDVRSVAGEGACSSADDEPARIDGRTLSCPNETGEAAALDDRTRAAARLQVDALVLDQPDAWYAAGPRGAGFCGACSERFNRLLQTSYGEQFVPYPAVARIAEAPNGDAPFAREHAQQRLAVGIEAGARLSRRARDEARSARGTELLVGGRFHDVNPVSALLASRLDFALVPVAAPSPERAQLGDYEILRAALQRRPVVGMLDAATAKAPGVAAQAWRLATSVGASIAVPSAAPQETHEAIAQHRKFLREFHTQYRPTERLAETLVVYSPACDHWTEGRHGAGVRAVTEALTQLNVQYRVVLSVPAFGSEPLVLADAAALPNEDAQRLQRRVEQGSPAIVVGRCGSVDEVGRAFEGPFPELTNGLDTVGSGSVFTIDPTGTQREVAPLLGPLETALDELLGRGRRVVTTNRPTLVAKLFIDPEKKLDVHLVGRAWNAASGSAEAIQGAVLRLSGVAVGGARVGWLFTQGGPERKIPLTPFNMGVQAALPDFIGSAVLTVSR